MYLIHHPRFLLVLQLLLVLLIQLLLLQQQPVQLDRLGLVYNVLLDLPVDYYFYLNVLCYNPGGPNTPIISI